MKISLCYPKIPDGTNCPLKKCHVFEKYDGTNLHWVWNKNKGWHSFGTRRTRFPLTTSGIKEFNQEHPGLEDAPKIFLSDLSELEHIFLDSDPTRHYVIKNKEKYSSNEVIIFTEFLGEHSFAGQHITNDSKKLVLFDVMVDNNLILPEELIWDFRDCNIAKLVYKGSYSGKLIEDIRKGKWDLKEGAVCKGTYKNKIYMTKIKTNSYLEKLKNEFKDNWKNYWE